MAQWVDNFIVNLSLNAGKFTAGIKGVTGELRTLDKQVQQSGDKMQLLGSTVANAFAASSIVRGINATIQASANLTNAAATAEQVFGDAFDTIEKFSQGAVDSVGLSQRAAVEATTFLGGLGKAAGLVGEELATFSIDMVKLAADMAASFNTTVSDATAAIQSGFSGSSIEPLRRYNIIINDTALKNEYFALTGEKVTDVLSFQQRQLAFVSLLYKQTADYQGQFARESGEALVAQQKLAAEFENLQATVGEALVPAFTALVKTLTGLTGAFNALPADLQRLVSTLGSVGLLMFAANRGVSAFATGLRTLGVTATTTGRLVGAAKAAISVLSAALILYSLHAQRAAGNAQKFIEFTTKIAELRGSEAIDQFRLSWMKLKLDEGSIIKDAPDALETFEKIADQSVASAQVLRDAFAADPTAMKEYGVTLSQLDRIINDHILELAQQETAEERTAAAVTQTKEAIEGGALGLAEYTTLLEGLGEVRKRQQEAVNTQAAEAQKRVDEQVAAQQKIIDNAKTYNEAVRSSGEATRLALAEFDAERVTNLSNAFQEFLTGRMAGLTGLGIMGDTRDAFAAMFTELKENEGVIPDIFKVGQANAREFRDAISAAATAVNTELNDVLVATGGNFDEVAARADALRERLRERIAVVAGLDLDVPSERQRIDSLVDSIIPTDKEIEVGIKLSEKALRELKAQLAIERIKEFAPDVALQLQIDLAEGELSPRAALATAQRIMDENGLEIDLGINEEAAEGKLVRFAKREREAIVLGITVDELLAIEKAERTAARIAERIETRMAGPGGAGWPAIVTVDDEGSADAVARRADAAAADRDTTITVDDNGTAAAVGDAIKTAAQDRETRITVHWFNTLGPGGTSLGATPVPSAATLGAASQAAPAGFTGGASTSRALGTGQPVVNNSISLQAAVIGAPFDVMRAVDESMRRAARLMPTRY